MSEYKTKYFMRSDSDSRGYKILKKFNPKNVMSYYDLWSDGSITIYIKEKHKIWAFFRFITEERIIPCHDSGIIIKIEEIPERKYCKKEE